MARPLLSSLGMVVLLVPVAGAQATVAQVQPSPAVLAPAPAAAPSIEALGIVRSPAPGRSVAILRSSGRTRVVAVGETAFGARLAAISADGVTLEIGGLSLPLRLSSPPPPAPPAPRRAAAPNVAQAPPEDPATPPREMDKRQVQMRLADEMQRILADTAIAPVLEEGRVVGVQLTRVPEGSLLTDAGLRAGDVVTRINDTQIDGLATLIGLWPRLQNATELRAVVLRGGQPVSLQVTMR